MTLREFEEQVKKCSKCALCQGRTNVVFGDGDENADLVFVGEAPGHHEDIQGKPFVGAAGKLLTQLLESIGLKRDQIYITNILKCRPPNNRDPLPEEVKVCKPVLFKQLEIIKPKVVVTLGAHSTKLLLDKQISISKIHGQLFKLGKYNLYPVFHPAAALYNRTNIKDLEEDFAKLKEMLDSISDEPCVESGQDALF